jgi:hypothetical protein
VETADDPSDDLPFDGFTELMHVQKEAAMAIQTRGRVEAGQLTWRDAVMTLFVAGAVATYVAWETGGAFQGVSTRTIAAVVFACGWVACNANRRELIAIFGADARRRPSMAYVAVATTTGVIALLAGIYAIVDQRPTMLATLVGALVGLWVMSTARHALASARH